MSSGPWAAGTYIVPAARLFTRFHRAGPDGAPCCGEQQDPDDLWVRTTYDPDLDGPHQLCRGCGGTWAPAEEVPLL